MRLWDIDVYLFYHMNDVWVFLFLFCLIYLWIYIILVFVNPYFFWLYIVNNIFVKVLDFFPLTIIIYNSYFFGFHFTYLLTQFRKHCCWLICNLFYVCIVKVFAYLFFLILFLMFSVYCWLYNCLRFGFSLLQFLAHLSWKLKWAILIAFCPSSVWRLSVRLLHFRLLLQNRWANCNQSWHKSSLGKGDSDLFIWRATPYSKGR